MEVVVGGGVVSELCAGAVVAVYGEFCPENHGRADIAAIGAVVVAYCGFAEEE